MATVQASKLPWNWRETVIERIDDGDRDEPLQLHSRQPSQERVTAMATTATVTDGASGGVVASARFLSIIGGPSMSSLHAGPSAIRKKKSKVSFADPEEPDRSATASPAPSVTSLNSPQTLQAEVERIEDLCRAIHKKQQDMSCLGLLVDEQARKHRISLAKGMINHSTPTKTVSLKVLLSQAIRMEKRDRLILGVKLSSSILQLYDTPWLRDIWSKSDIFFVKYEGDGKTLISKPFLSKAFESPLCTMKPRALTEPYAKPSPDVRNQTIFALGVVLMELWFGKPLETLRLPTDLGDDKEANQITDFATARRLSEEIYSEAGDWYGDAVRRCIYCEFDQRNTSLDAEPLKEAVYRGVVSPLQDNLTSFCGGKLDEILS